MTDEQIRIAVAEACGWKGPYQKEWLREAAIDGDDIWGFCGTDPEGNRALLPKYPNDLNAFHWISESFTAAQAIYYPALLFDVICATSEPWQETLNKTHPDAWAIYATARQRCQAFLRMLGKWSEDPSKVS